jgi:HAD superfamily hydrolase (TIGR01549 family)
MRPNTIFFDVGNTLLFPNRQRILMPLAERGLMPSDEQWRATERKTKREFDEAMASGCADHGFWWIFYRHLLAEFGIQDEELRTALTTNTRQSANWDKICPGTNEALGRIGERYRLGIISNADGKIDRVLERCGIGGYFQTITDSGLVGREKPDPVIFKAALDAMSARPEESLYVGDMYTVDYLGATRAGMQALLMDVAGAYEDEKWPRVESLEEVESLLNLDAPHP